MDPTVHTSVRRFVLAFLSAAVALALVPPAVQATGPALMRLVDANSDVRAQVDGGRVRVGDGNGALTVDGSVNAEPPRGRHGYRLLDISPTKTNPRSIVLADNLVLTDVVLNRFPASTDEVCVVWLHEQEKDAPPDPIHIMRLTGAEPSRELHLQTGITSTAPRWGILLHGDCLVGALWSGYTAS